ncbi:MAG: hypothetical protein MK102_07500 [Fuerstiella sp.]|nr:hypothetical protein [Fuerstiella sp.]
MNTSGRHVILLLGRPVASLVIGTLIGLLSAVPAFCDPQHENSLQEVYRYRFDEDPHWKENWDVEVSGGTQHPVLRSEDSPAGVNRLYFDNRQGASLKLKGRQTFSLSPRTQYTLTARLRMQGYYGEIRVDLVDAADTDRPSRAYRFNPTHSPSMRVGLAGERARSIAQLFTMPSSHQEFVDLSIVFFAPDRTTEVFIEVASSGGIETLVEEVAVCRNLSPVSTFETGIGIRNHRWFGDTFFRTGRLFEAESVITDSQMLASEDVDGDGRWSLLRLPQPEHPKMFPVKNPWLFSEYSVLKSDSSPREQGGTTGILQLHCTSLYHGRYEVFLSDTCRDAAVSLDGHHWRIVRGGKGELNLGLVDVGEDGFRLWIDHRHPTSVNPGPIYVDYVRFMPVYVPENGIEKPQEPPTIQSPLSVQDLKVSLVGQQISRRKDEWVWCGIPFSPGQFRPSDGVSCDAAKNLTARPLLSWRDGSVKWLGVEFQADDISDRECVLQLQKRADTSHGTFPTKQGRSVGDGVILDLGDVELRAEHNVWDTILFRGKPMISGGPGIRCETETGMVLDELITTKVTIHNNGPHPTLHSHGYLGRDGVTGPVAFEAWLAERAPGVLGLTFSVVNISDEQFQTEAGCSPAMGLRDLQLIIDNIEVRPQEMIWPSGSLPAEGRQVLRQDGSGPNLETFAGRWSLEVDGQQRTSGSHTEGWTDICGSRTGVGIAVREFIEKYPKSLAVEASDGLLAVQVGIWPADAATFRWSQGTRLTVDLGIYLHEGTDRNQREAALAAILNPLRAVLPPAHYCNASVFHAALVPAPVQEFLPYEKSIEAMNQRALMQAMSYGHEHWGDVFQGSGYVRGTPRMWGNQEYGQLPAKVWHFARTAGLSELAVLEAASAHYADIDVCHYSTRKGWTGGSHPHSGDIREGHQIEPPNFAHIHGADALLWTYLLTGHQRLKDTAVEMADFVLDNMPPHGSYSQVVLSRWGENHPPFGAYDGVREFGLPLQTVCTAYEITGKDKYLQTAHRLADYGLRLQDPEDGFVETAWYFAASRQARVGARYDMNPALMHYWELTGDRRVERFFAKMADFLLDPPNRNADHIMHRFRVRSWFGGSENPESWAFAAKFSPRRTEMLHVMKQRFLSEKYNTFWPDHQALDANAKQLGYLTVGGHAAIGVLANPQSPR